MTIPLVRFPRLRLRVRAKTTLTAALVLVVIFGLARLSLTRRPRLQPLDLRELSHEQETLETTTSSRPLPRTDLDVATRHLTVRKRCEDLVLGAVGRHNQLPRDLRFPMSPVISSAHSPKLFFCPLAKAGSTFFTRYMIAMSKPGPMVSPFQINVKDAHRDSIENFDSLRNWMLKSDFLTNSFRFLFVRNPWGRIFSAYIDKTYSPNPIYWQEWGALSVKLNRLPGAHHPCGAKVSFKHFIKALLITLHKSDLHFVPMAAMCRVCDIEWDVVGQVEHSVQDLDFLSSKINVSSAFQHRASYSKESVNDVIVDSTTDALGEWREKVSECVSMFDAGRMIWRKLQIRGVIYSDAAFPFSRQDMESVTADDFQDACRRAAEKATDRTRLKHQKEAAFREAYATVDMADLQKLRTVYNTDFYLFGYDPEPASIFGIPEAERGKNETILDWSRSWT